MVFTGDLSAGCNATLLSNACADNAISSTSSFQQVGLSFVAGLLAKLIALVVTFPLIRAKTVLISRDTAAARLPGSSSSDSNSVERTGSKSSSSSSSGSKGSRSREGLVFGSGFAGVVNTMQYIVRTEGLPGLYFGCGATMGKATLSAGLSLALSDKIRAALNGVV